MAAEAIFLPFFGVMLLTLAVWVLMYVRRLTFLAKQSLDPQQLSTPEKGARLIPEHISWPAYNFRNLFELPVIFYALCLYLHASGNVDSIYLAAAWGFFALRVIHSAVHCTVNIVKARFLFYMLGAMLLWFMLLRAALGAFGVGG